jgi:hypothetical protein
VALFAQRSGALQTRISQIDAPHHHGEYKPSHKQSQRRTGVMV